MAIKNQNFSKAINIAAKKRGVDASEILKYYNRPKTAPNGKTISACIYAHDIYKWVCEKAPAEAVAETTTEA